MINALLRVSRALRSGGRSGGGSTNLSGGGSALGTSLSSIKCPRASKVVCYLENLSPLDRIEERRRNLQHPVKSPSNSLLGGSHARVSRAQKVSKRDKCSERSMGRVGVAHCFSRRKSQDRGRPEISCQVECVKTTNGARLSRVRGLAPGVGIGRVIAWVKRSGLVWAEAGECR